LKFSVEFGFRESDKRLLSPWNSTSGEQLDLGQSVFHGAKDAKFGEIGKYFSLRSWRLGEKIFVEAFS